MLELLPLAETATLPFDQLPETADPLRTTFDGILTIGAVAGAYRVGRRAVMGYFMPDDLAGFDPADAVAAREPKAVAVMAGCYLAGLALTSAAVYLLTVLAWALAWAGAWLLVGAALALLAAKNASPMDDVRLLAEMRAHASD